MFLFLALSGYVVKTEPNNRAAAETTGFPLNVEVAQKSKMPPTCGELGYFFGENLGEITLVAPIWRDGKKTTNYVFMISEDQEVWEVVFPTTGSSKKKLTGLAAGKTYYFKGFYQNAAGRGMDSPILVVTMQSQLGALTRKKRAATTNVSSKGSSAATVTAAAPAAQSQSAKGGKTTGE